MILQALTQHYESLAEIGEITELGFSMAKVSYGLHIDMEGTLKGIITLKVSEQRGKKTVLLPRRVKVPEQLKRSSGVAPNFLCDTSSYFLGVDDKGKPKRARECFESAKKLHLNILQDIESEEALAVKNFFESWNPEMAEECEVLQGYLDELVKEGNLIFLIDGTKPAQEAGSLKEAWKQYKKDNGSGLLMQCLVTGEKLPVAKLHPSIKGVKDAQSSGASIVSFNDDAYESFGRHGKKNGQGLNAPVSEYAAFAYGTALNHLIEDRKHMQIVGDSTVVYWAEKAEPVYKDVFLMSLEPKEETENQLKSVFDKVANGYFLDFEGAELNLAVPFYVLGLAPNAARLSVRFFIRDSFGTLLCHLKEHYQRLEIIRPEYDSREYLSVWNLLQETVNKNSREKTPSPVMAGAVLRAILNGGVYPRSLLNAVMMRIRADQDDTDRRIKKITRGRAAIIKAYLMRNSADQLMKEVLTVGLNESSKYLPYVLGRLFSVLEGVQQKASGGNLNSTIKDRYFNSACATPAVIFPVLLKLYNNHIRKVDNTGMRIYFEQSIGELTNLIEMGNNPLPKRLSLEEQGVFILGYYHQTQKRFEGKKKEEK